MARSCRTGCMTSTAPDRSSAPLIFCISSMLTSMTHSNMSGAHCRRVHAARAARLRREHQEAAAAEPRLGGAAGAGAQAVDRGVGARARLRIRPWAFLMGILLLRGRRRFDRLLRYARPTRCAAERQA